MMNQATAILLIDLMSFFVIISNGNPDDGNMGNVKDVEFTNDVIAWLYILSFALSISVHVVLLIYDTLRSIRILTKRTYKRIST